MEYLEHLLLEKFLPKPNNLHDTWWGDNIPHKGGEERAGGLTSLGTRNTFYIENYFSNSQITQNMEGEGLFPPEEEIKRDM